MAGLVDPTVKPAGGLNIVLTSSDPTLVPVSSVTVPEGTTEGEANLSPGTVGKAVKVTITGTLNGASRKTTFTVRPLANPG